MPISNKAVVERFVEIINSHDFSRFVEVVADDYRQHNPHASQGLAGLIAFFDAQLQAMPDLKGAIDLIVSEGDHVAAKTRVAGTRDGTPSEMSIADFWRVADGKLVEHW